MEDNLDSWKFYQIVGLAKETSNCLQLAVAVAKKHVAKPARILSAVNAFRIIRVVLQTIDSDTCDIAVICKILQIIVTIVLFSLSFFCAKDIEMNRIRCPLEIQPNARMHLDL